jgi:hypothetical protein
MPKLKMELSANITRLCLEMENGIMDGSLSVRNLIKKRTELNKAIDTLILEELPHE